MLVKSFLPASIQEICYLPKMKRSQLIEYGIIVTGLLFGYKFFESLFSLFIEIIFSFDTGREIGSFLIRYIPMLIVYFLAFILLIKRSGQITAQLVKDGPNETVPVKIDKQSLLQVILICLAISTILSNIADIVIYLYKTFKQEIGRRTDDLNMSLEREKMRFRIAAIQSLASLIVLYYYRQISSWFLKKPEANELIFESEEEK